YDNVDQNFEARFWHAMTIFKKGDYLSAMAVFSYIDKNAHLDFRRFPSKVETGLEETLPHYFGMVARKRESFLFVRTNELGFDVYCNERDSEEKHWDLLSDGARVQHQIRF